MLELLVSVTLTQKDAPHVEVHAKCTSVTLVKPFVSSATRPTQSEERNCNKRCCNRVLYPATHGGCLAAAQQTENKTNPSGRFTNLNNLSMSKLQKSCLCLVCLVCTQGRGFPDPKRSFRTEETTETCVCYRGSLAVAPTLVSFLDGFCNTLNTKRHVPEKTKNRQNLTWFWYVLR